MKRCGECENCKKLDKVKTAVLRNCGTPKIRGGKHVGTNHADDNVVALWNKELSELPCSNPKE